VHLTLTGVLFSKRISNLLILDVMKVWLIFLLFPVSLFAQVLDKAEIEAYVHTIDSLLEEDRLEKFSYVDRSMVGGHLSGYYNDGELVYINGENAVSFYHGSHRIYLKDTKVYKYVFWKHWPDEQNFQADYDSITDTYDWSGMPYLDTTFALYANNKFEFSKSADFAFEKTLTNEKIYSQFLKNIRVMVEELDLETDHSIIFKDKIDEDFSYTSKWDYPLGVYVNRHGQVSCDGFCPEGAWGFRDEEGKIYEDSLEAFYALVDTMHEFHSLNSQAHQYEWGQSAQLRFTKSENGDYVGVSACDASTHSALVLTISGDRFNASVDFNSIRQTPRQNFQLKTGILVLDSEAYMNGILKGKFDFTFENTLDSEVPLTWKGTFYSGQNQIKAP
jgi:hypothetical protein